jgi:hypothetical protein
VAKAAAEAASAAAEAVHSAKVATEAAEEASAASVRASQAAAEAVTAADEVKPTTRKEKAELMATRAMERSQAGLMASSQADMDTKKNKKGGHKRTKRRRFRRHENFSKLRA